MTAWTEPKRSYSFYAISICSFVYIYFTPLGVQEYVRTPLSPRICPHPLLKIKFMKNLTHTHLNFVFVLNLLSVQSIVSFPYLLGLQTNKN